MINIKKILYILFLIYSLIFILSILSAPILASNKYYEHADFLYNFLSQTCHQQPTRSFWLLGYPFAACARCTGIYLLTSIFLIFNKINLKPLVVFILLAIGLIEILLEKTCLIEGTNFIRFLSGSFLGISIGFCIVQLSKAGKGEKRDEVF